MKTDGLENNISCALHHNTLYGLAPVIGKWIPPNSERNTTAQIMTIKAVKFGGPIAQSVRAAAMKAEDAGSNPVGH